MAFGPTQDFIVNSGLNVQGVALATSSTGNTSTLQVDGGAGIAKNLIVGSDTTIYGNLTLVGSMPYLTVDGNTNLNNLRVTYSTSTNLDVGSRLIVGGLSQLNNVTLSNLTQSTSSSTGALVVDGGVGIRKDLWVGGRMFVGGGEVITTSTLVPDTLQAVTERGTSTNIAIIITNSTASVSTNSGALVVNGGVGIGGALYVNTTSYINSSQILTAENVNQFAVKTITAGTDTQVNVTFGDVVVWNTSTLQSVTDRGSETTNSITITNATASADSSTGALIVTGGVGIGENLNVAGNITAWGNITANGNIVLGNSTASDTITIAGEIQSDLIPKIAATYNLGSQTNYWNTIWANSGTFYSTVNSSSTTTGALKVFGGVGIAGNVYANGKLYLGDGITSYSNLTTATSGLYAARAINLIDTSAVVKVSRISDTNAPAVELQAVNTSGSVRSYWDVSVSTGVGGIDDNMGFRWRTTNLSSAGGADRLLLYGTGTVMVLIPVTTATNSTASGALVVKGGVGIGGGLFIGGVVTSTNTTSAVSTTTGALQLSGGAGIGGDLYVGGTINGNLGGGSAGAMFYQINTGTTTTLPLGTNGYILSAGGSAPQWVPTSGLSAGSSTTATNLAQGGPGQVPYQSTPGTTLFIATGTAGTVLVSNGTSAPTFNSTLTLSSTIASISTATGALQVRGGLGVADSVYVGNRVGFVNTSNVSVVYQYYNASTNSLDTVFA